MNQPIIGNQHIDHLSSINGATVEYQDIEEKHEWSKPPNIKLPTNITSIFYNLISNVNTNFQTINVFCFFLLFAQLIFIKVFLIYLFILCAKLIKNIWSILI